MTAKQLLDPGWAIFKAPDQPATLHTRVQHWNTLTWAHQTAIKASANADANGEIAVDSSLLTDQAVLTTLRKSRIQTDGYPLPVRPLPATEDRLKAFLEKDRISLCHVDYDSTGLIHTGPDGSQIYTCEDFWGPLNTGYPEVQAEDLRTWENPHNGYAQAPYWTSPSSNGPT